MTDKCPICLEELVDNIGVAVPCGHCYHRDCFARLKEDSEQRTCDILELALLQRCCICKKKVKKFHDIFLSFDNTETSEFHRREEVLMTKNKEQEKTILDLQSLSADQSEVLCRLVPRHDQLEARCVRLKQERRVLKQQVNEVEDENWELRFDFYTAEAKLVGIKQELTTLESKLEQAAVENKNLQDQVEEAKIKRKESKAKMKQIIRNQVKRLDNVNDETKKMRNERETLQVEVAKYRLAMSMMKETRKHSPKTKLASKKSLMRKHKKSKPHLFS